MRSRGILGWLGLAAVAGVLAMGAVDLNRVLPSTSWSRGWLVSATPEAAARKLDVADTLADLALADPTASAAHVRVRRQAAAVQVGGGVFRWDSASTAATNTGTVVASIGRGVGRWLRVYEGPVELTWFGAVGDGVTDDTAAIQAALATGQDVHVAGAATGRVWLVSDELVLHTGQSLRGDGPSSILTTSHESKPILLVEAADDVTIQGLCLRAHGTTFTWSKLYGGEAIKTYNTRRLRVLDCVVENAWQYGIKSQALFDSQIARCRFHRWPAGLNDINSLPTWERAGIFVWQVAEDNVVEDCVFDGATAFDGTTSETGLMKTAIMFQCVQGTGGTDLDPGAERWVYQAVNYGSMRRNVIRNNRINGMSRYGINIYKKYTITDDNFTENEICGNQVRNVSGYSQSSGTYCTGAGIYNQSPTRTDIHDNTVVNCGWRNRDGGLAGHGITVGGEMCRVAHNRVERCPAGGIKYKFYGAGEITGNKITACGGIWTTVTASSGATTIAWPEAYRLVAGDTVKVKWGGSAYSAGNIMTRTVASVDKVNNTVTFTVALDNAVAAERAWFYPNAAYYSLFAQISSGAPEPAGGVIRGNVIDDCASDQALLVDSLPGILIEDNVIKDSFGNLRILSCHHARVSRNVFERFGAPYHLSTYAGLIHVETSTDVVVTENRMRDSRATRPSRTALITASSGSTGNITRNIMDTGTGTQPVAAAACNIADNILCSGVADWLTASGDRAGFVTLADSAGPSVSGGTMFASANPTTTVTLFASGVLGQTITVSCTAGTLNIANGTFIKTISGSTVALAAGSIAVFKACEINAADNRLVWYQIK